jgi:hypothetical protein
MLTKDNNKGLFENPKNIKNVNKIEELYISQESNMNKLRQIIKEKDNIILKNKTDYNYLKNKHNYIKNEYNKLEDKFIEVCDQENELFEENNILKNKIEVLKIQLEESKNLVDKNDFINDELLYMDFDIFEYESEDTLKKKVISYERQLDYIDEFLNNNNVSNFEELTKIVIFYKNNNNKINHDGNINIESNKETIKPITKSMSKEEINQIQEQIYNSSKNIKDKLNKIKEGDIITIKGIKRKAIFIDDKLKLYKIENIINKIKMVEEEFNNYCQKQISWAKDILGNNYDDKKIIKLLDIYNKLCRSYNSDDSSDDELDLIANEMETVEKQRFGIMCKLGNNFINNNVTNKSQISDFVKKNKKILHYYDVGKEDNKVNRFISTCKRLYLLSENINVNNIIKSKCITNIRDMNNIEFDTLLKLIENKNINE